MDTISLTSYNSEIMKLLEQEKFKDVILHCLHILQIFPKYFNSYRHLAKAYLEMKQYSEAEDAFLRVLSVIPNDFVAHIGMSIVREDENNLEAAVWHMERAFEQQPVNRPVQDELRRLYMIRDGAEPVKIRMTKGALIRMYTRGNLLPQAVAKAEAALSEEPERLDLQAILANLYYSSNLLEKSITTCETLVEKVPYCLVANQILADSLPRFSRENEAVEFSWRLAELDPCSPNSSAGTPVSNKVDDQPVSLEKLELTSSETEINKYGLIPLQVNSAAIPKDGAGEWLMNIENYHKSHSNHLGEEIAAAKIIGSQAIQSPSIDSEIPLQVTEPSGDSINDKTKSAFPLDHNLPQHPPAEQNNLYDSIPHPTPSMNDVSQITPELPVIPMAVIAKEFDDEDFGDHSEPPIPFSNEETVGWSPEHHDELDSDRELDQLNARQSVEDGFEEMYPVNDIPFEMGFSDSEIKDQEITGEEIQSEPIHEAVEPIGGGDTTNGGWIPIDTSESSDTDDFETSNQSPIQVSPALQKILPGDEVISEAGSEEEITQPVYPARLGPKPPLDRINLEEENPIHEEILIAGTDAEIETPDGAGTAPPMESESESFGKKAGFLAWLHSVKSTVQEEINEQILPRWLQSGKPTDHIQVPEMSDLLEQPLPAEITGIDTPQMIEPLKESDQTVKPEVETESIGVEYISEEGIDEDIEEKDQLNNLEIVQPELDTSLSDLEHPKFSEEFDRVKADLDQQNFGKAADRYHKLMKNSNNLLRVIASLEEAVQNYPGEICLFQTLGDAYVRSGRLQDALDIYTKAEELLQ